MLKSSKTKIEESKKRIYKIIEDSLLLNKIKTVRAKNDLMFHNSANDAQNNFEDNIDKLFKEKMEKINEINKKYDTEIYELKQDIDEEDIIKKNETRGFSGASRRRRPSPPGSPDHRSGPKAAAAGRSLKEADPGEAGTEQTACGHLR